MELTFETLGVSANVFLFIGIGFLAGSLGGFLGIGGGILVTPFLHALGIPIPLAVPTSMNYIFGMTVAASVRNMKAGNTHILVALFTALIMLPAVEGGAQVNRALRKAVVAEEVAQVDESVPQANAHTITGTLREETVDTIMRSAFLVLIAFLLVNVLRKKEGVKKSALYRVSLPPRIPIDKERSISFWVLFLFAILAGFVAGIFGVGGGFILVPLFLAGFSLDTRIAIGTSTLVILCSSLYGSVSYGLKGMVDYRAVLFLLIGAIPGGLFGASGMGRIDRKVVRVSLITLFVAAFASLLLRQFQFERASLFLLSVVGAGIVLHMAYRMLRARKGAAS